MDCASSSKQQLEKPEVIMSLARVKARSCSSLEHEAKETIHLPYKCSNLGKSWPSLGETIRNPRVSSRRTLPASPSSHEFWSSPIHSSCFHNFEWFLHVSLFLFSLFFFANLHNSSFNFLMVLSFNFLKHTIMPRKILVHHDH